MRNRVIICLTAAAALAATGATVTSSIAMAAGRTVHIHASLNVTGGPPPVCTGGICTIQNNGTGEMPPFGQVTFTTVITADGNQPPCGPNSQWVNRIVRTIDTSDGILVLHEAGLQCPQPGVGPRVEALWVVDGADSTGKFAGASGQGTDIAYPLGDTAAPRGWITFGS
jgi:hypothetical protein